MVELDAAWNKRKELRDEGYKLLDEGQKLRDEGQKLLDEGNKLWDKGQKLWDKGQKLWDEGNRIWHEACIQEFGRGYRIEWISGDHCIVEGLVFK